MKPIHFLVALSLLCLGAACAADKPNAVGPQTHTEPAPVVRANTPRPEAPATTGTPLVAGPMVTCDDAPATTLTNTTDPRAREAAQHGLDYLAERAVAWQNQHNCYGCHVQAVTLEAFAIGRKHQYEVKQHAYDAMVAGLTTIPGGTRQPGGLRYAHGDTLQAPSKAFGAVALSRHDQWVARGTEDDILQTAIELLAYQQGDGSIRLDWVNLPVGAGDVQGVYQAIQTWQYAYARTADPRWSAAVQKSEGWLQSRIDAWYGSPPNLTQDVNYALLGLLAAGVGSDERTMTDLRARLLAAQGADGGWGFGLPTTPGNEASNPFVTGQTLYTLRLMGLSDSHDAVRRGTSWLMQHQQPSGGWSDSGFGKAEAMWAVLGLVSLDVVSIEVTGLPRGTHVIPNQTVDIRARDNSGAKVSRIDIAVDDIRVQTICGDTSAWSFTAAALPDGLHIVDITATNDRGETARRRIDVYSGEVWLTQLGSRYHQDHSEVTLRDLAPDTMGGKVQVTILATADKDGKTVPAAAVRTLEQPSAQGAMTFAWDGKDGNGKAHPTGQPYIARVAWVDKDGKVRQTEELSFVHDTLQAQQQRYSQIGGQLQFGDDAMAGVANTVVELLDDDGNVLEQTRTTEEGNYRFNAVKRGRKYKVRVKKAGFADQEKDVDAPAEPAASPAPAKAEAKADFEL